MKADEPLTLSNAMKTAFDLIFHPLTWTLFFLFSLGAGVAKGRAFSGFLWGLLLGPLGFLVVLCVLPDLKKRRAKDDAAKEAELALLRYQDSRRNPSTTPLP